MNIICQSLYYQYILDKFHFFKPPKTFRVIITIILCCPCYMPKYYTLRFYFPYLSFFVSATGQYFSIWTGPDQYNVFFRILSELVFCLRYTITKTCRLLDLHVH